MYTIKYFLVACCICAGFSGLCQQPVSDNKKAEQFYREAMSMFRGKMYDKALDLLSKAEKIDPGFPELYFLQADIYHEKKDVSREIEQTRQGFLLDSLKYPAYYFSLAECYFSQGNYGNALVNYRLYLSRDQRKRNLAEAEKNIRNCEFALDALKKQIKQKVIPFIQSDHDVYWPSLDVAGNMVVYTSLDHGEENIWILRNGALHPLNLNTVENEGTQSLTADGSMMYFTACGRRDGMGSCDIYVSYRLSDTLWSMPVNLGYPINTEAWDAQPSISADGTKLYFASTREGGRGGSDIWFSRLLKREPDGRQFWSEPQCLYFNTAEDEMAPFLYFDRQTLFFSSDGYPGMGGKDIYKVNVSEVSTPVNVGTTVNTHRDELGFIVDASGKWGYFASDINGRKSIYKYLLDENIACEPVSYVEFRVPDKQGYPLSFDGLIVMDIVTGDTLACYDEFTSGGRILACAPSEKSVLVNVRKKGYMFYSDTLNIGVTDSNPPKVKEIVLEKLHKELSLVLKGVFFDVDDYKLKEESFNELKQLSEFLRQNPEISVEISGHTDNSGSNEHNYELSEARAFEVYKYLFINKIPRSRMSYKGFGKDRPLVPNDTEEHKAMNRRTEIRVK